jgi:hypothetical protein
MQTNIIRSRSPYLKPGRLADVIAALQIMGARQRPEGEIVDLSRELSGRDDPEEVKRWTAVYKEHPEFFLTYFLDSGGTEKAALRWRYTNKLYDPMSGKEFTQEEKEKLPQEKKSHLTTKPLPSDAIGTLMNTAIELHSRALDELAAKRWWIPILAACLGFIGALTGAVVAALWAHH